MSKPTKIILDKQSDLILTNAQIVGATGIVKSDLPGLVTDLANLDTAIQTEATDRSVAIQTEAAARAAEIAEQRLRIDAILDGADVNLNQFREVVAFVQSIDLANDTDLLAKVAEINGKISAEETARIAGDAKLTADLATLQSYVDTTVNSAITQLTSDLADLQSYVDTTVDSAITSLTADLSVETAARIADVDTEEARALAAEAALQAAIDAEAAARIAADETLDGKIADIISNTNAPIIDSFTEVVDNLNVEIASRIEGDSQLSQQISDEAAARAIAIDDETVARIAGDENLQSEIDALTQAVNVNITDTINNEAAARIAGDSNLQSEIDLLPLTDGDTIEVDLVNNYIRLKEVVAAPDSGVRTFEGDIKVGAQPDTKGSYNDLSLITKGILDTKVSQEVSNINNSISEEVSRAQNAESQLQSNIDTQTVRIDAILEAAGSETDNFAEIVQLINSVDTTNDEAFASYVISNNERLSVEEQERLRLTNLLGDGLVNEQIAREDGDAFLQHEFDVLPTTDGESIELNPVDNTIRLKEVVESPASGYRVLKGDIKTDVQPDTKESFSDLSFVTKGWVDSKVNVDLTSALQAEEDARTESDATLQANIESTIAEEVINRNTAIQQGDSILQAEIDLLPLTDGDTIEVDLVNNYVRLKEVVAAPDSGVRTFEGDIKVGAQPDTKGSYNDLSLITKGILDTKVSQEVSTINSSISDEVARAQNAEGVLQSNIDTQTVRIDAILEAAGSETDNFAEIVALINSVDTTNDEAFASYVISNNQRLTVEEQERLRLTNLLGDSVLNEQIAREDGDAVLQHEFDVLPTTDGESIEVNPVDNTIRLKDVIDAPDAGYRTFKGDVKAQSQPETNESFNELSFVTKGWVDSKVNVDVTYAIETEESERIAADTTLQGLIDDEAAARIAADNELHTELTSETERAISAEDDLQNSLNNEIESRIADVNIEEARAMAAEANLQAAIDAEAAARIATDETLDGKIADIISNSNAPIIDSFTEVVDSLNAEIARAQAAEADEVDARKKADNDLKGRVAAEAEARIAGDAQLSEDLTTLQSYVDTTVNSAIETLTSDLSAETAARIADVDAEEARALAAEGVLQTNINTEANERVAEDITLQGNIDIEATRAQSAETAIAADLGTETAARIAAVSAEEARATAAEFELTSDLAAEAARATAAEGVLQTNINTEKSRIDAILIGASASADNFAEIVQLINSVDTTNDQVFAGYVLSNDAVLSAEAARAIAAEGVLTSDLSTEAARAIAAEGVLTSDLSTEAARATAAEATLTAALSAEEVSRIAGDESLQASLNNEISDRIAAGQAVQTALDNEAARAIAAETTIAADLDAETAARIADVDAEEARALAAEAALQSDLDAYKLSNDAALAEEHAHHTAAEAALSATFSSALSSEVSRAIAAEAALSATFSAAMTAEVTARNIQKNIEEADRIAADAALQSDLDAYKLSNDAALAEEHAHHTAAEAALSATFSAAMTAEVSRATAAEGVLQSNINTEKFRIDAILIGASASADNFAEIVTLINSVDTTNDQVFAGYVLSNDAALAAEESSRIAGDVALSATFSAAISAEVLRATSREDLLFAVLDGEINGRVTGDAALSATFSAAMAVEVAARIAGDAQLSSDLADLQSYVDTTVDSAITTLTSDLANETEARIADVDAEEVRALAAELVLTNNLSFEEAARITADAALSATFSAAISFEEAARITAVAAEEARAISVETAMSATFSAAISFEEARAIAAELVLTNNLSSEEAARIAADAALSATLQSNIDEQAAKITAILDGSTVDLNQFAEVVAFVQSIDMTNDQSLLSVYATFSAAMSAEEAARIADVDAEEARAIAAEGVLTSALSSEESSRIAADAVLSATFSAALSTETVARITAISSEESSRIAGDAALSATFSAAIYFEESSRIAGDAALSATFSAAMTTEVADRIAADAALSATFSAAMTTEVAARIAGDAALSATFSAAMTTEVADRIAGDAALSADFANIYSKKVAVTGTPNGVLTTFTLALPVRIGSEMIYVNGLLMEEGEDYTTIVTSGKVSGVEFLYAPISEMKVKAYGVCGVINNI